MPRRDASRVAITAMRSLGDAQNKGVYEPHYSRLIKEFEREFKRDFYSDD